MKIFNVIIPILCLLQFSCTNKQEIQKDEKLTNISFSTSITVKEKEKVTPDFIDTIKQSANKKQIKIIIVDANPTRVEIVEYPVPLPILTIKKPPHTEPENLKNIIVQLLNDDYEAYHNCYIFYYCPEMETGSYSFEQKLGRDNNFVGTTDIDGRDLIKIPDELIDGAKLIISSIGYQPFDIPISNVLDTNKIEIRLQPKTYTIEVVLNKPDEKININVLQEKPQRMFYGECKPIYYSDGSHGDPICAFSCMDCNATIDENQIIDSLNSNPNELEKLYKELKNKNFTLLLSQEGHCTTITTPKNWPRKKFNKVLSSFADASWKINNSGGVKNLNFRIILKRK